jgi:GMP synthase (glutamine-hydrolysing)
MPHSPADDSFGKAHEMIRTIYVWLAVSAVLITPSSGILAAKRVLLADPTPVQSVKSVSNVWIVVNLFNGRTSKQAVLVRDTLARHGAGGRGIVMPYAEVTVENMEKIRPRFLALSPNGIPWCRYRGKNGENLKDFFFSLKIIIEEMNIPVVGICGGHQALALAFGGKVGPIRGGEDDCFPYGNNPTERGRHNVHILTHDPLFLGSDGQKLNLVQSHYDEVKRLPKGFIWLAHNKKSPYQIIRHPTKPAYGIQAHTEYYMRHRPDGGTLLRNFIKIAADHNRFVRINNPGDVKALIDGMYAGPRSAGGLSGGILRNLW